MAVGKGDSEISLGVESGERQRGRRPVFGRVNRGAVGLGFPFARNFFRLFSKKSRSAVSGGQGDDSHQPS